MVLPTFPLYARDLGASLTFIGILASFTGLSTAIFSVPSGLWSDRVGRRIPLTFGLLCYSAASFLYTFATNPYHLLPARFLAGLAQCSTFPIGFAYASEVENPSSRKWAIGLYMTSMGAGFTVGPVLGGWIAQFWGYKLSYYSASLVALAGASLAWRGLKIGRNRRPSPTPKGGRLFVNLRGIIANRPSLLAANVANFFDVLLFQTLFTFFPLYAAWKGLDELQIGSGFAFRGLLSALVRLPAGVSTKFTGPDIMMILGLAASTIVMFLIPHFSAHAPLSLLLAADGIAYGFFLTAGYTFVADESPTSERGMTLGFYSAFSSLSTTVSPSILGVIADLWGLDNAFITSAYLASLGILVMTVVTWLRRRNQITAIRT
jgi:MFS family permease